ncbi:hypothetical protein [Sphingomonas oligoaromativorans]|uniref:hypothetical protein n=1 Tax=Sphingomonas oligoaromativorans TaxID=575322 RepID=UPI0014230B5A|nr:hypothetical protein [Sphingomonas oligoaromativorans]NIJ32791.1 hypothetical protein [Sphingomonas oligoaromativorans]
MSSFPDHRLPAKALLTSGVDLRPKEAQFLGGIAFDPHPLTEWQVTWLRALLQRHGLSDTAESSPAADSTPVYRVLDRMRALAEADPADQLWAVALMKLAQLVAELGPHLLDNQAGMLIAVGALIMPLANAEAQANVEAQNLLQRVQGTPRG